MALVRKMEHKNPNQERIHGEVGKCTYSIFRASDEKILQIDTYGSDERKNPDIPSQIIQFDSGGIKELRRILEKYDNLI